MVRYCSWLYIVVEDDACGCNRPRLPSNWRIDRALTFTSVTSRAPTSTRVPVYLPPYPMANASTHGQNASCNFMRKLFISLQFCAIIDMMLCCTAGKK